MESEASDGEEPDHGIVDSSDDEAEFEEKPVTHYDDIARGDDCRDDCCRGPTISMTCRRSRDRLRRKKAKREKREHASPTLTLPEAPIKAHPWSTEVMNLARWNYQVFHKLPTGTTTIEHVIATSLGVEGWAASEVEDWNELVKVGHEVHPIKLCGLWIKEALLAAHEAPGWECVIITVDAGASDTVVPPHIAKSLPLLDSPKVGIEYEVANGGVVTNLGERRGEVKIKENSSSSFIMSFQVVENVHKPLLAVSKLVEAGQEIIFSETNPRIVLSN